MPITIESWNAPAHRVAKHAFTPEPDSLRPFDRPLVERVRLATTWS